jgi:hypothetical protein
MNVGPVATSSRIVNLPANAMFTIMVQCDLFSVDGDHNHFVHGTRKRSAKGLK